VEGWENNWVRRFVGVKSTERQRMGELRGEAGVKWTAKMSCKMTLVRS